MDNIINQLETFVKSDDKIFKVPPLSIEDRKLVHNWCQEHNFHSYSKGQQPNRYMVIEKLREHILSKIVIKSILLKIINYQYQLKSLHILNIF